MGRSPCCAKEGLNRGAWTAVEDRILTEYIRIHGEGRWRNLPKKAGLKRCGKSCRLRWLNYLRPDIKRGNISHDEEELIIRLHKLLGNRWSLIAGRLPGRTDNEIKNYWNTYLGKKVQGHSMSTSTHKQYSNQYSKEKKKPAVTHPSIEPFPPSPKIESRVVRTKALRCTKVVFTPQPQKVESNNVTVGPSMVGDHKVVELESYDDQYLSTFTPGEDNSSDFMMDLNVGELCLSDLLQSDFSQLCDFDNALARDGNNDVSPSSGHHPFVFHDEMREEDWMENGCFQHDVSSNLRSLASFLESEDDWLAE